MLQPPKLLVFMWNKTTFVLLHVFICSVSRSMFVFTQVNFTSDPDSFRKCGFDIRFAVCCFHTINFHSMHYYIITLIILFIQCIPKTTLCSPKYRSHFIKYMDCFLNNLHTWRYTFIMYCIFLRQSNVL